MTDKSITYDILRARSLSFKMLVKAVFDIFWVYNFSSANLKVSCKNHKIAIIGPYFRKDYFEILSHYKNEFDTLIDFSRLNKKYTTPSPLLFLKYLKSFSDYPILERFYLSLKNLHYSAFIDHWSHLNSFKVDRMILFSASHPYEAQIAELLAKKGVYRIGLQHAFYMDYVKDSLDSLPYDYSPVDELWIWGDYHYKIFQKLNIQVKLVKKSPLGLKKPSKIQFVTNKKILVLLPRKAFRKDNIKLLSLLGELSYFKFDIKVHPKDSIDYYNNKLYSSNNLFFMNTDLDIKQNKGLLVEYGFAITFNSTAYIDIYMNGLRCLYFDTGNNDFSFRAHNHDIFNSQDSIGKLFNDLAKYNDLHQEEIISKLSAVYDI